MKREQTFYEYLTEYNKAKECLRMEFQLSLDDELLSSLLGHHFDSEKIHEFLVNGQNLETYDLLEILRNEIRHFLGSVEFDSQEIYDSVTNNLEKARIRDKGLIWTIHKNDKDPFPSNPHAHEYNLNYKMDLNAGIIYKKGKQVGKLGKKDFDRLKTKITEKGIELPK